MVSYISNDVGNSVSHKSNKNRYVKNVIKFNFQKTMFSKVSIFFSITKIFSKLNIHLSETRSRDFTNIGTPTVNTRSVNEVNGSYDECFGDY